MRLFQDFLDTVMVAYLSAKHSAKHDLPIKILLGWRKSKLPLCANNAFEPWHTCIRKGSFIEISNQTPSYLVLMDR